MVKRRARTPGVAVGRPMRRMSVPDQQKRPPTNYRVGDPMALSNMMQPLSISSFEPSE